MRLGLYDSILLDRPLPEAIQITSGLGLQGIELNTGGFASESHIPNQDEILISDAARDEFLGLFEGTGVEIAGLNCNGNPLHPSPAIGQRHAEDVRRTVRLAARLGQTRVVTMSGLPGGEPGSSRINWVVNAWNTGGIDVLDYQWEVVAEFWREIDQLAGEHGVKVALELHPQNVVFNTSSVYQFLDLTEATNVGVELDASHLFWQQMDPVAVVRELGSVVFHAAAKDVRINEAAALHGVLNNGWRRAPRGTTHNIGGDEWSAIKLKPASWDFVALGKGHPTEYWTEFLRALNEVDPNMWINIEHEDEEYEAIDGLRVAAEVLTAANAVVTASAP